MNTATGVSMTRRPSVILRSKITPPVELSGMELRPRLIAALSEISSTALLLIQAPAGYGKTTLLKQFLRHFHEAGHPVAWLTLYHTENDPTWAIAHIAAAFGTLDPEINREMEPYFSATPPYPIEDVIASLIHCLERFKTGVTIMLDDYHEITNPAVHSAVFFFLSNLPPNVHCVIASRTRPPFEFSRLEVRGKVTTLDRNDLRFDCNETALYLKNTCNLNLSPENLAALSTQTEGWITAIKLVAVSMKAQSGDLPIQKLVTGSHHELVEYLTEAVLNKHDDDTRQFLLQTAPLGRLTAELCDAVTQQGNAAEQLKKLARENLFLNPLDTQGKWFRYHSLFSEFLCGLLSQSSTLDRAEIHKRASQWYDENSMPLEAVEHAIASGDAPYATAVIDASVQVLIRAGQVTRVLGWLTQLPESMLTSSPNLLIHLGWCQALAHRVRDAKRTVELAERLYGEQSESQGEEGCQRGPEYLAELGVLTQCIKRIANDHWDDVKPLLSLKESLNPDWVIIRALVEPELGYIYLYQDKLESAYAAFQDAHACAQAVPNTLWVNISTQMMASIRWLQGRRAESESLCREGILNAVDEVAGRFHMTLAKIYYETNALDACRDNLEKSIALISLSSDPELLTETEILAAKLVGLEQGPKAVVERLYEAERLLSRRGTPQLLNQIRAHQVWYLIECQDLTAAEAILRQCEMPIDKSRPAPGFQVSPGNEFFFLALCRYWMVTGSYTQSGVWLRHFLREAESAHRVGSVVLINGLLAVLLVNQDQSEAAVRLIRDVMVAATESRFARSITDIGNEFIRLLEDYCRLRSAKDGKDSQDPVIAHMHYLLEITKGSGSAVNTTQVPLIAKPSKSPKNKEVNSLTPRELQVLEQVAKGMKNREVAEELLIAESSVQWHVKNLYAKLDVHNRTEATAKARELNLIR